MKTVTAFRCTECGSAA